MPAAKRPDQADWSAPLILSMAPLSEAATSDTALAMESATSSTKALYAGASSGALAFNVANAERSASIVPISTSCAEAVTPNPVARVFGQVADELTGALLSGVLQMLRERAHLFERIEKAGIRKRDQQRRSRHALLERLPLCLGEVTFAGHRSSLMSLTLALLQEAGLGRGDVTSMRETQ
jgi:hypothetical protein